MDLAHCIGPDRAGNPIKLVRDLARTTVDIALDYDDSNNLAIWDIKKALQPHFHIAGTAIPDQQWIDQTIQQLVSNAFSDTIQEQETP